MNNIKNFIKNFGIYGFGEVFVKALSFILYPIYAAALTTQEFGIVGIASLTQGVLIQLVIAGTSLAAFNFYHSRPNEREQYYSTIFIFLVLSGTFWLIVIETLGPRVVEIVTGYDIYNPYIRIVSVAAILGGVFMTIPKATAKTSKNPREYVLITSGEKIFNHVGSLIFIFPLALAAKGYLLGHLFGVIVVSSYCLIRLKRMIKLKFSKNALSETLRYSLPVLPHSLSYLLLTMIDRVMLSRMSDLGIVGIYTVGYGLALGLFSILNAGDNTIMPDFASETDEKKISKLISRYFLLATFGALSFQLGIGLVFNYLFPDTYASAESIFPWLSTAAVFYALYLVSINVMTQFYETTKLLPLFTGGAVGLNIASNIVLIPNFGMVGAAISTTISYLLLAVLPFLYTSILLDFPYERSRIITCIIISIPLIFLPRIIGASSLLSNIVIRIVVIVVFFSILNKIDFWDKEEMKKKQKIVRYILNLWK